MNIFTKDEEKAIDHAIALIENKYNETELVADNANRVKQYCQLKLAHLEHEVFAVLFLNNKNHLIKFEIMFRGTINQSSVYPREIIKKALQHNAAAIIISHNHPSGDTTPSSADQHITKIINAAANLMEIRLLDHMIVGQDIYSFAEAGYL